MEDFKFSTIKYERPDIEALKETVRDYYKKIKEAKSFDELNEHLLTFSNMMDEVVQNYYVAYVRNTLDTTDKFYEDEIGFLNNAFPELSAETFPINQYILECPFKKEFDEYYGEQYLIKTKLDVDKFKPELVPFIQEEAVLTTRYQKLMATAKIPFEGEELNLYGIQKHFGDLDREKRKKAFKAYSDFYHKLEPELEEIWDKLISVRNKMGQTLGFKNYIPLGHMLQGRLDYGAKEIESFRNQVKRDLVPLCEELYEAQRKRIGVDTLYAYDEHMIFSDGNVKPIGDDEFMIKTAREMYENMSPETGEFINYMIDHELLDLKNKPGKASTGYMIDLPAIKAPFVFSCLNGTKFDMEVLTHELGHAFAGYRCMRKQKWSAYYNITTDIAEIHSMSMEQFCYQYADRFFGDDADKYRFAHLSDAITFVPFGVAVDEFQNICYEKPELSPKERTYEWHKLEEKYMPWRKYEDDEFFSRGGFWYHKLHIFQHPMYYINYTLTTMGAMEFKKRFAENKEEAFADYLKLCDVGASRGYLDTLKLAHVSNPFEEGSVKRSISYAKDVLEKEIEKWQ